MYISTWGEININFFLVRYITNGMEDSTMDECVEALTILREDFRWTGTSNKEVQFFQSPNYSFGGYYNTKYD